MNSKSPRRSDWPRILKKAGLAGRKAILQNYTDASRHKVMGKGMGGDMTLRIDKVSEQAIYRSLKKDLGKDFVFLSEEVGEVSKASEKGEDVPVVVCDPLDGSHNAEVGIPFFSLALSVIEPGQSRTFGNIASALITSIKTEDEYVAQEGRGAFHNGKRLKASSSVETDIRTLLVECSDIDYLRENILARLTKEEVNKTRLLGSAAMSYCMLSQGSGDAMVFAQPGGARSIDSPAGFLIAREAGCTFSNVTDGAMDKSIDGIEVGFDSRLNIAGARNSTILSTIEKKMARLP
jgi:myo-inositol-1(or 4)-monophosphatase